jgi:hypothetical protein
LARHRSVLGAKCQASHHLRQERYVSRRYLINWILVDWNFKFVTWLKSERSFVGWR